MKKRTSKSLLVHRWRGPAFCLAPVQQRVVHVLFNGWQSRVREMPETAANRKATELRKTWIVRFAQDLSTGTHDARLSESAEGARTSRLEAGHKSRRMCLHLFLSTSRRAPATQVQDPWRMPLTHNDPAWRSWQPHASNEQLDGKAGKHWKKTVQTVVWFLTPCSRNDQQISFNHRPMGPTPDLQRQSPSRKKNKPRRGAPVDEDKSNDPRYNRTKSERATLLGGSTIFSMPTNLDTPRRLFHLQSLLAHAQSAASNLLRHQQEK